MALSEATATSSHHRPPLVLVINDQEWSMRSYQSILGPSGFAVLQAYTGRKGLERARLARPDIILVDLDLPDIDGVAVCRQLRSDPAITASTPIIMTTAGHPSRGQRLEALRAGAWDFVGHPIDAEELLLRFHAYVEAKFDADHAREEGLLDELTGLYNLRGLARRAREIASHASRRSGALACVIVSPEVLEGDGQEAGAQDDAVQEAVARLADLLKKSGRASDVIGKIGNTEFAVFAPDTDEGGAASLAKRLAEAIERSDVAMPARVKLRAGYHAVGDFRESSLEPVDLLKRASSALYQTRRNRTNGAESWIQGFSLELSQS
ncbi:MAG: response regulator [Gemmatimonadetes bacterium]|nr:response regulator [Gemmatimonadota bacterium]